MDKINFSKLLTKKEFVIVITFFFIVIYILHFTFFTPNTYRADGPVKFEIKKGENLNEIADKLFEQGIIPSKFNFKVIAFIYGAEKKIRAARYFIPNKLNYLQLVELFLYGKADYLRKVRIFAGSTLNSAAGTLKLDALIDSSLFVEAANSRSFLDSLGINANSALGYLLPDEYEIYERSDPREIIKIFYGNFNNYVTDSLIGSQQKNLSLHELVTLASIVEGETKLESEMPTIAGVYFNRLKIGMKLQADPTVQFFQKNGWKRLTYKDLHTDHPYNTYKYFGLPPGPINNPGKSALKAAFFPEKHNFLYFVANGNGGHNFSNNYFQHLKFVREYRRWLSSQK